MSAYVITAKVECAGCPNKEFTKKEGKEIKFPWICNHPGREGKNPAIETNDVTEVFSVKADKKIRHCELVYVAPPKQARKPRAPKAPKVVATPVPEAPAAPVAAPANA